MFYKKGPDGGAGGGPCENLQTQKNVSAKFGMDRGKGCGDQGRTQNMT